VVKKIPGTLEDWDRLQVDLGDLMLRVWRQREAVTKCKPNSKVARREERALKLLEEEEERLRSRIAGLSRHLHIELKNR